MNYRNFEIVVAQKLENDKDVKGYYDIFYTSNADYKVVKFNNGLIVTLHAPDGKLAINLNCYVTKIVAYKTETNPMLDEIARNKKSL